MKPGDRAKLRVKCEHRFEHDPEDLANDLANAIPALLDALDAAETVIAKHPLAITQAIASFAASIEGRYNAPLDEPQIVADWIQRAREHKAVIAKAAKLFRTPGWDAMGEGMRLITESAARAAGKEQ